MGYLALCIISFLTAIITLLSGFGLGTVLLPIFSLFFAIKVAISATAFVHIANNIFKLFLVGKLAHMKTAFQFALPAAIAAAFGAWLLAYIGNLQELTSYILFERVFYITAIKIIIGICILTFSLLELLPIFKTIYFSKKYIILGGIISGFFGGLSGLQGALRSMFLLKIGLTKNQYIGTSVVCSVIVDFSRLFIYGWLLIGPLLDELRQSEVLTLTLLASFSAFAGSVLGAKLLKTTPLETVHKIVSLLLIFFSLALMGGLI